MDLRIILALIQIFTVISSENEEKRHINKILDLEHDKNCDINICEKLEHGTEKHLSVESSAISKPNELTTELVPVSLNLIHHLDEPLIQLKDGLIDDENGLLPKASALRDLRVFDAENDLSEKSGKSEENQEIVAKSDENQEIDAKSVEKVSDSEMSAEKVEENGSPKTSAFRGSQIFDAENDLSKKSGKSEEFQEVSIKSEKNQEIVAKSEENQEIDAKSMEKASDSEMSAEKVEENGSPKTSAFRGFQIFDDQNDLIKKSGKSEDIHDVSIKSEQNQETITKSEEHQEIDAKSVEKVSDSEMSAEKVEENGSPKTSAFRGFQIFDDQNDLSKKSRKSEKIQEMSTKSVDGDSSSEVIAEKVDENESPKRSAFRNFNIFDVNPAIKKSVEKFEKELKKDFSVKSTEIVEPKGKGEEKVESSTGNQEFETTHALNRNTEGKNENQKISEEAIITENDEKNKKHTTNAFREFKIFDGDNNLNKKSEEKSRQHTETLDDIRPESSDTHDNFDDNHLDSNEKISTLPEQSAFRDMHLFETKDKENSKENFDDKYSNYDDMTSKMDSQEKYTNYDEFTGKTDSDFESLEEFGKFEPFKNDELNLRDVPDFKPTTMIIDDKRPQNMLSTLVFPPVPRGELYKVQALGLGDGFFLFSFVGVLMSLVQSTQYPIGLAKDVILNRVSPQDLIYQSLSSDAVMVTFLSMGAMLALVAPVGLAIVGCVSAARRCRGASCEDDNCSDKSAGESCGNCRRRGVVFAMQIILVLSVLGIAGVFIANEEIAMGTAQTTTVARAALGDANTFVRNSNAQLNFVVSKSLDQAVDAALADLNHMDQIVGRPVQREVASLTAIDVALDLLMDISMDSQSMAEKCVTLQHNAGSTRQLARATHERLVELKIQVDALKRQCSGRDRPLCDTLDATGLEVTMSLDRLLGDLRLAHLRKLRNDTLSAQIQTARSVFQLIPHQMEFVTRDARQGIKRELELQRQKIRDQLKSLDELARQVSSRLQRIHDRTLQAIEDTPDIEQWRWIVGLVSGLTLLMIWLLLLSAILCGCCGAENQASCTVIFALLLVGLFTTAMWALALSSLVIGAHGEQLLCKPLYEEPDFKSLTVLFDNPGGVYGSAKSGLLSNLAFRNESLDVPLRTVLAECRDNTAAYNTFRLSRVFDAEHAAEHRTWGSLHAEVSKLQVDLRQVQVLTPELQRQLQTLLDAANVDVMAIRNQLSGHVTSKDVSTFAKQLESVAGQIRDSGAATRLDSLVTRARRLLTNNIQPLEQRKEDLVYQLTALEVRLVPLQKQLNQSLAQLKTIQFLINNQGSTIAQDKSRQFSARLLHYMDQFQNHVLQSLRSEVAQCRPVWNIFQAGRQQVCKYIVDPVNGLWLSLIWCLVLLLIAIPTGLKLVTYYRRMKNSGIINKTTISQESPPATNAWASPSNHGGEQNENW